MNHFKSQGLRFFLSLCATYAALPATAFAGNDDEVLMGSDATIMGGAVTALVDDGSALWYNPAGLGARGKNQLKVSGSAYTLRLFRIPEYLESPDGKVVDANTVEFVTLPTAVTFARSLDEKWTFAAGYFLSRWSDVKGHSELKFDDENGEATWQVGYVQTDVQHNGVIGASYKQSSSLHFGASLIGFYKGFVFAYESSGGVALSGDDPNSNFITASDQGQQNHGGLQGVLGLQWSPTKSWRVGVSLRTPGLGIYHSYEQHGYDTAGFDLDNVDGVAPEPGDPARQLYYKTETETLSEFKPDWIIPARLRLGIGQKLERLTWSVDVDYQHALKSRVRQVGEAYFQATDRSGVFNARVGAKYATGVTSRIGAGLFTDRNGERRRGLGQGKFDFYGIALGAELGDIYELKDDEEVDKLRFSTTLGLKYALGIGQLGSFKVPPFNDLISESANGDASDRIDDARATAHEITINLGAGLFF